MAEYPDGRIELWAEGTSLPYTTYDRLAQIDQGAIVEHKRLGHALAVAAQLQAQRDDRRWAGPSRTLVGEPPRPAKVPLSVKRQRLINQLDLEHALQQVGLCPPSSVPVTRTIARRPPPKKESKPAQSARSCRHLNVASPTTTKNRPDKIVAGTREWAPRS